MARILYAVQGDGLGHAVRAHSVALGLMQRGHDVRFVSSLKGTSYLNEHFPGLVTDIFGFCLIYENGRVRRFRTVLDALRGAARFVRPTLRQVQRLFLEFRPHLVVADGEWFAPAVAKLMQVPFVSLDNQHLLTHCEFERPWGTTRDFLSAYAVVRLYHTGAQRYLISTFFTAPIRHQPTTLIPPVLRNCVYKLEPKTGDYWVAYLGGSGDHASMRRAIESFDEVRIRAYGFGLNGQVGHVTYKPISMDGFLQDLEGCAAVVSSAGHTLIGECLYLRKPMLLIPFGRQFEQRLNAFHVSRLGVGRFADELRPRDMSLFADELDAYRLALNNQPKPALNPVLDALERELA